MKTYTLNAIHYTLILAALVLMPIGCVYAWDSNDNSDKLSNSQSNVFSPGYINAAKQKAYEVIKQSNQSKSWWESLVDTVKNKLSNKLDETDESNITPELKMKTSSNSANAITTNSTASEYLIDSTNYNVPVANRTDKVMTINGVTHRLVGFGDNSYSTIVTAMSEASAGDIIVVYGDKNKVYNERGIQLKDGVKLYGGYTSSGIRDLVNSPTIIYAVTYGMTETGRAYIPIINGTGLTDSRTEISGFTFQGASGSTLFSLNGCSNVVIANNTFEMPEWGLGNLRIINSNSINIINNTFGRWSGLFIATSSNYIEGERPNAYVIGNKFTESGPVYSMLVGSNAYVVSQYNDFIMNSGGSAIQLENGKTESSHDYFRNFGSGIYLRYGEANYQITNKSLQANNQAYSGLIDITRALSEPALTTGSNSLLYRNTASSLSRYGEYGIASDKVLSMSKSDDISSIFKGLLANKNAITGSSALREDGGLNTEFITRLVDNNLSLQALAIPLTDPGRIDEMSITLLLANILRNPTEDQKAVLTAVEALLTDMKNIEEKTGKSSELTKAENDLLQMVAAVLLAQGVPDLFKEGDIAGIKGIFKDLGTAKDKIMMGYSESIKPYYSNIIKELIANLAILQLKGILSNKINEEKLKNLEPKEVNKILENIRRSNDKSFEMAYILQQDNKYRKEYLDPSNKVLENNMKLMLTGFTQKINKALEDKK